VERDDMGWTGRDAIVAIAGAQMSLALMSWCTVA
jgi:hypothetical protein